VRPLRLATHLAAAALLLAAAINAAGAQSFEERLSVCLACHGEKGQSENAEVPSLGAQQSQYVVIELYMFRQGLRKADPMTEMTKDLSDADLQKFADTIAKLPAPSPAADADAARMQRGAALVNQHRCNFCHNRDFSGNDAVPRLAGQREDYLLKSLREYKAGTRTEYQPVMAEVVPPLKDADLVELAYYIAHFKP
jgi:cytochrome c553